MLFRRNITQIGMQSQSQFSTWPADGELLLLGIEYLRAAHSFPCWLVLSYCTVRALVIATCGCLNYHDPVNGRATGTVMSRLGRLHLTQLLQTVLRVGLDCEGANVATLDDSQSKRNTGKDSCS